MIYGLNFNRLSIPNAAKRLFAARLGKNKQSVAASRTATWLLQGVCETEEELNRMVIQADNGKRTFHIVRRQNWIAVYTGWV